MNISTPAVNDEKIIVTTKHGNVNVKTGQVIDSSDVRAFIDFDKIAKYKSTLGFYQIVTSELTMNAREVIDKYHGLSRIEDQFKVMKETLDTRPHTQPQ